MLPTADTLRFFWHMLAGAGTLLVSFLFIYELVKARSLAKAQELARHKRGELTVPGPREADDPWAPKPKKNSARIPSADSPSLTLRPYERPAWRSNEY